MRLDITVKQERKDITISEASSQPISLFNIFYISSFQMLRLPLPYHGRQTANFYPAAMTKLSANGVLMGNRLGRSPL